MNEELRRRTGSTGDGNVSGVIMMTEDVAA